MPSSTDCRPQMEPAKSTGLHRQVQPMNDLPAVPIRTSASSKPPAQNFSLAPPSEALLSPKELRSFALSSLRIDTDKLTTNRAEKLFRKNFGSSSEVVSRIWSEIVEQDKSLKLVTCSKMNKNLRQYLIAMYWLWTYPKNAEAAATAFGMRSSRNFQGKALWSWIQKISSLKEKRSFGIKLLMILTPPSLSSRLMARIFDAASPSTPPCRSTKSSAVTSTNTQL